MAKALVTGASGFIGSHLVSALAARGDEVTCLVRKTSEIKGLDRLGMRLVYGDVTEPESLTPAVTGQDIVYHLAGLTMALTKREFFRVNQGGICNMAQVCAAQASPPVLVVASSLAAAGPAVDGRPKIESDPAEPVSEYGRSKRAGEKDLELLADRVPATIIRAPIVLGEGDHLGLPMFRSVNRFGIHVVPGRTPHLFSLIHAADLVELMILAAQRGKRLAPLGSQGSQAGDGYYFAACEEDLIYDDLGRLVGAALGRRRVFPLHVGKPAVWVVAAAVETVSQIMRRPLYLHFDKAREIIAGSWICSPRKAADDLGFSVKAPIAERLRQTADWYRSEGWL
jgi:nucleoside-diphosphate-sugar epimerase